MAVLPLEEEASSDAPRRCAALRIALLAAGAACGADERIAVNGATRGNAAASLREWLSISMLLLLLLLVLVALLQRLLR